MCSPIFSMEPPTTWCCLGTWTTVRHASSLSLLLPTEQHRLPHRQRKRMQTMLPMKRTQSRLQRNLSSSPQHHQLVLQEGGPRDSCWSSCSACVRLNSSRAMGPKTSSSSSNNNSHNSSSNSRRSNRSRKPSNNEDGKQNLLKRAELVSQCQIRGNRRGAGFGVHG